MLETKVRRAAAATKNDDPEQHQPTTKLQHHHQSIATRPGMHSNAATAASSMKMDEKWTIGGASSKNVPPQPTLNGGGDWMVLGKQLQRMVSLRLQDAEAKAHDDELRYQPPRLPADQMDMFGREPLTDGLDLVICNHCAKPVLASRFCAHLERCPRMPDLSFTPPGSELSQNKRKSAAHPAKAAASVKKARVQEELLNNGSNTTTTSTKAGGAKPKLSKAKAAGAAAADSSNAQVKRPKARAGGKAAEGGAKDGKTNGVEQEKLKIRISLKDKSKDAATDRKPPENGEKSKEKEKAKDKADREKEGGGKERAGKKERATKIVVVDLLQPLPLATRTYVRRNKLRCLALTFLSPPPSQTPIDHPAGTSPLLGAAGAANASYAAAQQQQRASPSMAMMSSAATSHSVSASPYPYAHHPASATSSSPSPTSSSALGSSPSYMNNPPASPSSSAAAAAAAAAMASHNGMTNGGGMMVGGANGYNLNSIMQSVGKKGSGTHSVTISPNALKMYQAKQKMAMMMAAQQAAAAAAANGMNMSAGDNSAMAGGGEQGFTPSQPQHASVAGQSGPYM